MKTDFENPYPAGREVVRLDHVSVADELAYESGFRDVSCVLHPGDLMLVLLEQGAWYHPLPDLVSGLIPAEQGDLLVFGERWPALGAERQARARGKIGRVFEGHGWISNLDIDENVTLAERHHTRRPVEEIAAETAALGRMVGLEMLPGTRVAVTPREDLRRAEWVRAAIGAPWLMLLERPGRDLADGWLAELSGLVEHVRSRGTAVIWMCENEDEWNHHFRKPVLKFRVEANTLRAVQES